MHGDDSADRKLFIKYCVISFTFPLVPVGAKNLIVGEIISLQFFMEEVFHYKASSFACHFHFSNSFADYIQYQNVFQHFSFSQKYSKI